jgi:hypothetical protein
VSSPLFAGDYQYARPGDRLVAGGITD